MEFPRPMHVARDLRGILADTSIAENHAQTLTSPLPGAKRLDQATHRMHKAINTAGRLANHGYERSAPFWDTKTAPVPDVETISVLGYGNEKVVYKLTPTDGIPSVLSVYHVESFFSPPERVLERKARKDATYRRYFGDVVWSREFLVVDNPWGEGQKPATLAPLIEDKQEFQSFSPDKLRTRAEDDPVFATSLAQLLEGYHAMRRDRIHPDLSQSNLVVSGSNVVLFDTGHYFPIALSGIFKRLHPNNAILEQLAA